MPESRQRWNRRTCPAILRSWQHPSGGIIVTIDGPAGTGKSSVARAVAARLGFDFLDTGAMYRAIGLEAIRREADLDDPRELAFVAQHCRIEFVWDKDPPGVLLNGEPVGHLLRGGDATRAASYVATVPEIRQRLVEQQREIGHNFRRAGLVTEGRDQGSVVFPDAAVKVFLTADPAERARRRAHAASRPWRDRRRARDPARDDRTGRPRRQPQDRPAHPSDGCDGGRHDEPDAGRSDRPDRRSCRPGDVAPRRPRRRRWFRAAKTRSSDDPPRPFFVILCAPATTPSRTADDPPTQSKTRNCSTWNSLKVLAPSPRPPIDDLPSRRMFHVEHSHSPTRVAAAAQR